jgi:hypothetical protein
MNRSPVLQARRQAPDGSKNSIPANCLFNRIRYLGWMQVSESIQCPFCGQSFELAIDTSVPAQRFTTDCEVCCRPFEVTVECEPGEILALDVQGN